MHATPDRFRLQGPLYGAILVLTAELCFVLATVLAKHASLAESIPGIQMSFVRFASGFIVAGLVLLRTTHRFKPQSPRWVFLRAASNTLAVLLFFAALDTTTVTNANLLNMTYPAFVLLFAPWINREATRPLHYFLLVLALAGSALVLRPDLGGLTPGDLLGLTSGLVAGFAIPCLREARKHDSVWTIVFWLFGVGMLVNGIFLVPVFVMPRSLPVILSLAGGGILGVLGQVMLTTGYRHISAAGGAIVSSSRILLAAILGIALFAESLTLSLVAGGLLILAALVGAAWPGKRAQVE